jgi:hypothetical protein
MSITDISELDNVRITELDSVHGIVGEDVVNGNTGECCTPSGVTSIIGLQSTEVVKRPFPTSWLNVLATARLSYLATASLVPLDSDPSTLMAVPHLSLMCMSFIVDDPSYGAIFIFSTRRDTKKFENLMANPRVSIMSHDFAYEGQQKSSEVRVGGGGTLSITCQGKVVVVTGSEEERLRAEHLKRNPSYGQFIQGPQIAICYVAPDIAQSCGINDRVENWQQKVAEVSTSTTTADRGKLQRHNTIS